MTGVGAGILPSGLRRGRLPVAGTLLTAATFVFAVQHAVAQCVSSMQLQVDLGVSTFYLDDRSETPPCPGFCDYLNYWVYEEANGSAGLQRGGQSWILGELDSEICIESASPDKLWL